MMKSILLAINSNFAIILLTYVSVILFFTFIITSFLKINLLKIIVSLALFLLFSLLYEYYVFKNITDGFLLVFILFTIPYLIILLAELFNQKQNSLKIRLFYFFISGLLTIATSVLIFFLYFWKVTHTSIFEGEIIIMGFLLTSLIIILSFVNFLLIKYSKNHLFLWLNIGIDRRKKYSGILKYYIFSLFILIILCCVFMYITGLNQISEMGHISQNDEFYFCFEENNTESQKNLLNKFVTRQDIAEILKTQKEKDITVLATIYLLTNEEEWGRLFKEELINLAISGEFTGSTGGDKAKQIRAARRAMYYQEIKERNPALFSLPEKELIENWFEKVNWKIYDIELVDLVYGFFFKKIPDGPYENQENGVGSLAAISDVIKEANHSLYQKNIEYIDKFAIGFKNNFRNPDDNFYYQSLWLRNAYFLSKYDRKYYNLDNLQKSIEWMLLQYPSTGQSLFYNEPYKLSSFEASPLDVFVLAQYLTGDGRYKWISERIIDYINQHREKINFKEIYGLQFWDENLQSVKPKTELCFLQGSTGIAQKPGQLEPDKIVFREGWDEKNLYALLNLRFSGWHSYPASNALTTIIYKEPFVVDNLMQEYKFSLLHPTRFYNDRKIDRINLNTFQLRSSGLQLMLHQLMGMPSIWRQDPPKFSSVDYFNSTKRVQYSRTSIENWYNWSHSRAIALKNDGFFVVLDHAIGERENDTVVSWHLRGDNQISDMSIISKQKDTTMLIFFPHPNSWYEVAREKRFDCQESYINRLYYFILSSRKFYKRRSNKC